jgi:hypothetical protein
LKKTLDGLSAAESVRTVASSKNCGFTLWTVEMPAEDVVVKEMEE